MPRPPHDHPERIHRARKLRRRSTPPEQILWSILRDRRLGGLKFRRQETIGPDIVDYCCREERLIVELDGACHDEKYEEDRRREAWLTEHGFRVIRLANADIADLEAVTRFLAREAGVAWNG